MRRPLSLVILLALSLTAAAQTRKKPNFGVQRAPDTTPEVVSVTPPKVQSPGTHTVTVKLANFNATGAVKVEGNDPCEQVRDARAVAADSVQFTFVTDAMEATGDCMFNVRGGAIPATVYVRVLADAKAKAALEAAERQQQQQQQQAFTNRTNDFAKSLGKRWDVTFGNGKKETWRLENAATGSASFKSSAGNDVAFMMGEQPMLTLEDCMGMITIAGGTATADLKAPLCNNPKYQGHFSARITP